MCGPEIVSIPCVWYMEQYQDRGWSGAWLGNAPINSILPPPELYYQGF